MTDDRNVILRNFIAFLKTKFPNLEIYVKQPKKKIDELNFPILVIIFTRDMPKKRFLGATIASDKKGEWVTMQFQLNLLTKDAIFYNDKYNDAALLDPSISGETLLRYLEWAFDDCLEYINEHIGEVFTNHTGVLAMDVGNWFDMAYIEPPGIYGAGKDIIISFEMER